MATSGTPSSQPWGETWEFFDKTNEVEYLMNFWKMAQEHPAFLDASSGGATSDEARCTHNDNPHGKP